MPGAGAQPGLWEAAGQQEPEAQPGLWEAAGQRQTEPAGLLAAGCTPPLSPGTVKVKEASQEIRHSGEAEDTPQRDEKRDGRRRRQIRQDFRPGGAADGSLRRLSWR